MNITFEDKIVIVTGGSRGIGRNIVKSFCEAGAKVHFTYLSNKEDAVCLEKELGNTVKAHRVDGRQHSEVENFINDIGKKYGKIDILVNNAGIVPKTLLPNTSLDTWNNTISTNLTSIYSFCTTAFGYLYKSGAGVIINISSLASDRPSKGAGAYSATKGAIESLSRVLALEYAPFNIRINTVAPGLIETDVAKDVTEVFKKDLLSRTPLKRFGSTNDVSNAILFLASDKASFITGERLYVSGGRHI